MLRVTTIETATEQTFILEGELVGRSVAELETTWSNGRSSRRSRKCVVDLSGVTFIDESGERVLSEMWKEGAEFVGGGVSTKEQLGSLGIALPFDSRR